jgi:hypothetical protein
MAFCDGGFPSSDKESPQGTQTTPRKKTKRQKQPYQRDISLPRLQDLNITIRLQPFLLLRLESIWNDSSHGVNGILPTLRRLDYPPRL